ncbi:MAG: DNA/RNA non-specific endonuclease [Lachnospiraceae bacterium]|nr:DNA/RNA non-specific endonuclease [Lachnospiraceae bacterium]
MKSKTTDRYRSKPKLPHKNKRGSRTWIIPLMLFMILLIAAAALLIPRNIRPLSQDSSGGSLSIADSDPSTIPEYTGDDCIELNGGIPCFNEWDIENITGENYSELDTLGRCGAAVALLDDSMMPKEPRGEIGEVRPSGWRQTRYDGLIGSDPPYLYNRCHLIAYALTGQNDNPLNLITGTSYMNKTLMLPWEEQVIRYLEGYNAHVLYRVTPYFYKKELLARGVEIEAYSVEDKGSGICFHVFIYNVQPGVELDYSTGESRRINP